MNYLRLPALVVANREGVAGPMGPAAGPDLKAATKINALTGVRFLAASMIVAHHINGSFGLPMHHGYALDQGVSVFFVLSGFILTYVHPRLPTWESKKQFLIARFARIWPAHVAAMVILFLLVRNVVAGLSTTEIVAHTIGNLTLIEAWIPFAAYSDSFNGPSWSISTEFFFYVMFPFLIVDLSRTWWWKLGASLALVVVLIEIALKFNAPGYYSNTGGLTIEGLLYFFPLGRLFEFVLGMCTALAWSKLHARIPLKSMTGTLIELGAFAFFAMNYTIAGYIHARVPYLQTPPAGQWLGQCGSSAIAGAVLIFVLACNRGWISRFLSTRPLVLLGEISYSIYLLHYVLFRAYQANASKLAEIPGWLCLLVYVLALLVLSHFVWAYIERPCRRWIVALGRPGVTQTSATGVENLLNPGRRYFIGDFAILAVIVLACFYATAFPRLVTAARAEEIAAQSSTVSRASFQTYAILKGFYYKPYKGGQELHLIWQTPWPRDPDMVVVGHLIDGDGAILSQTSYVTGWSPFQYGTYVDEVLLIARSQLTAQVRQIALAVFRPGSDVLPIDRGPRDWGGRRLLIPLPEAFDKPLDQR